MESRRPRFFGTVSLHRLVFALVLCVAGSASGFGQDAARPNILFLFSDDQRWDAAGFMGNTVIRTPALDALAARGTVFERAYVTTSICVTSRASVLTGQHYRRHGIARFDIPFSDERLDETYPAMLGRAGYYTGFIGKWGVGETIEGTQHSARIFDYFAGASHQANYWHERDCPFVTDNGFTQGRGNVCTCPPDSRGVAGPDIRIGRENIKDPVHLTTDVIPQKVKDFLEARKPDAPFCLSISFKDPHGPFQDFDPRLKDAFDAAGPLGADQAVIDEGVAARPDFVGESLGARSGSIWASRRNALEGQVKNYYRAIATLDDAVGQIVEELQHRGLLDNTVILFTSDNGMLLGEHGLAGKWLMYEPSVRVPGFVVDPRLAETERVPRAAGMVQVIDFTATILDFAGLAIPDRMQGKSLRPAMFDAEFRQHDYIFYEMPDEANEALLYCTGLIGERHKYVRYDRRDPVVEELFDRVTDPNELHNLAAEPEHQELLRQLRAEWARQAARLR